MEATWRFMFYLTFCIVGYRTLFLPEPSLWVQDNPHIWIDWPYHTTTEAMKFYYHIELGSYLHQLLWTEVSRSDSVEMLLHHFITLTLIFASFVTNFTRIGTLIMLIHDLADVFLEFAKVLNYTSKGKGHGWLKNWTDGVFVIFTLTFFVTRLVIYPRYILYSLFTIAVPMFTLNFIGAYVWIGLLVSLQLLHVFWFYLILRMVYRLATASIEGDIRSDDEGELEDEGSSDTSKVTSKKTS